MVVRKFWKALHNEDNIILGNYMPALSANRSEIQKVSFRR